MNLRCEIHSQKYRENKYELLLTVYDADTGKVVRGNQSVFVGKEELSEAQINDFIVKTYLPRIEAMLSEAPAEEDEMILKSDIEQMLFDRGYLDEGQTLEDLPDKAK